MGRTMKKARMAGRKMTRAQMVRRKMTMVEAVRMNQKVHHRILKVDRKNQATDLMVVHCIASLKEACNISFIRLENYML